ncbi:PhoU domain-containing protein [Candidatus Latescibacterota bacterium]
MFKQLMKAWSEHKFTSEIVEEFLTMIDKSEEMLCYTFKILTKNGKGKKFEEKIYLKDQSINITERKIRKQVLIHIKTNPDCNLSACLALISITKDAERLGDYVKNFFELKSLLKDSNYDPELFKKLFDQIGNKLLELFKTVAVSFKNSDKDLAFEAMNKSHEISVKCEEIIEEIVESDYTKREAVVLALGARFIKRIACHLSNIASSIVNPISDIDFSSGVSINPVEDPGETKI